MRRVRISLNSLERMLLLLLLGGLSLGLGMLRHGTESWAAT